MRAKFEKRSLPHKVHTSVCRYRNLHNLPHWHMEYEIIYVFEGNAEVMINNTYYTLSEGFCSFIGQEEIHYIKGTEDSVIGVIKTDAKKIRQIAGYKNLVCPVFKNKYNIEHIYEDISDELKNSRKFCEIIADGIVTRLVAEIFRDEETEDTPVTDTDEKFKGLLEMLSKNYADMTFEKASEYMNFSKPYFSKYFTKISGMSFTKYLNTLKVLEATEKILEGKMNITEISIACGFGTIRNFNRIFKEFTGYSPKQLPRDYVFIHNFKDKKDAGFDPTLNCTEILG